jgi:hypothetical protein
MLTLNNKQNHTIQRDPPSVLIFRRQSIQVSPNNTRIGLYYCKEIDKTIPITYSDNNGWKAEIGEEYINNNFPIISKGFINELYDNIEEYNCTELRFNDFSSYELGVEESNDIVELYNRLDEDKRELMLSYIYESEENLMEILDFIKEELKEKE